MPITHVTRHGPRLGVLADAPADQQWIHQYAIPFQISPTEAALSVNVRLGKTRVVDIEVGGDIVIFDDFDNISAARRIVTNRAAIIDHPRTGEKIQMACSPPVPGFIPFGARRADGSPHPHAGTGFGIMFEHGYPVALQNQPDTHLNVDSDIYGQISLYQFAYDGKDFKIVERVDMTDEDFLPGFKSLFMSLCSAIPSGDDLVSCFDTGSFGQWNTGFARWRRGKDGRWTMISHKVIAQHTCESSLVRDVDGSLLMLHRPWGKTNPTPNRLNIQRSRDEGETWERICIVDNFWQMCPVTINTALDGSPYVMCNRFREPRQNRYATREMIWGWPLSPDRNTLMEPIFIRDSATGFGPPTHGSVWRIDHPMTRNVRLRDGKWRHIVAYRGLEDAEMRTDAGATPMTGTYVEEIFSDGPPRPEWNFR